MAYATQQQIEDGAGGPEELRELTDLSERGFVDVNVLATAQAAAEEWINSYIERVHAVPLEDPVPAQIQQMTVDETIYRLKMRRRMHTDRDRQDHEERQVWLVDVSMGRASLGTKPLPAQGETGIASSGDRDDVDNAVTRNSLKGFW